MLPGLGFASPFTWLSALMIGALKLLWKLLGGFELTSPDVTVLPQVGALSGRALLVVNAVYVLAVLAAGIVVMVRETVEVRYGIGDLAPRLVVGLIAANLAIPLCRGLIGGANALTQALTGDSLPSTGALNQLNGVFVAISMGSGPEGFLLLCIVVLLMVLTIGLLLTWITRVGVLVVLTGISPLALACHALPYTEGVAKLWWRSMLATLGTVTAQAFALHVTFTVFLSDRSNLPTLGIPMDPGGTINLFIVTCMLWATVRIPGMAARSVTRGRSGSVNGLVRIVLVRQLSRGLMR